MLHPTTILKTLDVAKVAVVEFKSRVRYS